MDAPTAAKASEEEQLGAGKANENQSANNSAETLFVRAREHSTPLTQPEEEMPPACGSLNVNTGLLAEDPGG
eukprot:4120854-Prymnesium_polylepis.1